MMKKNWTKGICMALILGVMTSAITACQDGGQKQEEGKGNHSAQNISSEEKEGGGRFLESEIKLPEGTDQILAMEKLADNSIEVAGQNSETKELAVLTSKDGGTNWKKTAIKGIKREDIAHAAMAKDGKIFLTPWGAGKVKGKMVGKNGSAADFSFELPGKEDNQINQICFDKDGDLIALDLRGSLLKIGAKDKKCQELFDTEGIGIQYISVIGGMLFAAHENGMLIYDTESGERQEAESVFDEMIKKDRNLGVCDTDSGSPMIFCEGTGKEQILFANKQGIFHFYRGGSIAEQLVDGSRTSLGGADVVFLSMAALDESHMFVAVSEGKGDKLFAYSYDKDAASAPAKEITVYALDESDFLRQAVTMFQKSHPDTYVNLKFGMTEEKSVTLEDALSVLNTDMLAGHGPDVLILDGMPMDSYIEKGVLEDISDVVGEVDQTDGIFGNITEGSKKDGKVYAMPCRLLLPVVLGDEKTRLSGGSLAALADRAAALGKSTSKNIIPDNKGTKTLLRDCYYADSGCFTTEDGTLNQEVISEYLTQAKRLYDVDKHDRKNDTYDKIGGDGSWNGTKVGTCGETGLITGEWRLSFGTVAGMYEYHRMVSAGKQTKTDICLMNGDKVKTYIPYLMAGVTSGDNVDTAKEFVKTLLGKKAGMRDSDGFPVNRAAFEELCKEKMGKTQTDIGFSGPDDKMYTIDFVSLKQADVDKLKNMIESLQVPCMTNRVIQELVLEQGERYLLGEQDLDEAVNAILKKVNLYLSE